MRLFVAVNFNEYVRSKLISLIDELRLNSKRGSFVLHDNMKSERVNGILTYTSIYHVMNR